jgi:hypothetical protein
LLPASKYLSLAQDLQSFLLVWVDQEGALPLLQILLLPFACVRIWWLGQIVKITQSRMHWKKTVGLQSAIAFKP